MTSEKYLKASPASEIPTRRRSIGLSRNVMRKNKLFKSPVSSNVTSSGRTDTTCDIRPNSATKLCTRTGDTNNVRLTPGPSPISHSSNGITGNRHCVNRNFNGTTSRPDDNVKSCNVKSVVLENERLSNVTKTLKSQSRPTISQFKPAAVSSIPHNTSTSSNTTTTLTASRSGGTMGITVDLSV